MIDETGNRHTRLLVEGVADKRNSKREVYWRCKCDCGGEIVVNGRDLRRGSTKSCGCLRVDVSKTTNRTHGHRAGRKTSPELNSWWDMRRRCGQPHRHNYPDYGGRGIRVCDRWQNSFENFLTDMGFKPGPEFSLHRIDNDKGYDPKNCKWATPTEQAANRRPRMRRAA